MYVITVEALNSTRIPIQCCVLWLFPVLLYLQYDTRTFTSTVQAGTVIVFAHVLALVLVLIHELVQVQVLVQYLYSLGDKSSTVLYYLYKSRYKQCKCYSTVLGQVLQYYSTVEYCASTGAGFVRVQLCGGGYKYKY